MRTESIDAINITYPDALAYAFNAMPFVIELPSGEATVEITVKAEEAGYSDAILLERKTFNGKVTFDVSDIVRIQYDKLLKNDTIGDTLFSRSQNISLKVNQYATAGSSPTSNKSEDFKLSRFVRTFDFGCEIFKEDGTTSVMTTKVAVMYGRGGYVSDFSSQSKLWNGTLETMQFIIGPNTQVEIPGRMGSVKEVITGEGLNGYVGIVMCANFIGYGSGVMPEYINIVKSPRFATSGKLSESDRKITFTSELQVVANDGYARVRFLTPQCEIVTEALKPLTQTAVSEIEKSETKSIAYQDVDFGASRGSILNTKRQVSYNVGYRLKYASLLLPYAEIKRLSEVIGSAFVEITDSSLTSTLRVYPVPTSVELKPSQSLTRFNVEFELPTLNAVSI